MATRSLTAIFDSRDAAERAQSRLADLGIPSSDVRIVDQTTLREGGQDEHKGFWESVKDFFIPDDDRYAYAESVRRGGYLLSARVADEYADEAIAVLEQSDAIDLDTRLAQWRAEGWEGYQPATASTADLASRERNTRSDTTEQAIPIVEERVRVGKREVNRGGVRVRSYVVEQPVHEEVQLREERVEVERRPVRDERAPPDLLREQTIEATESAEEAVVSKDAVVTEEVVVKKFSGQRTKGIDETVRRTEVDVEDTRAEGRTDAADEELGEQVRTPGKRPTRSGPRTPK